ncbi:MAG: DUF4232 domain-containing protein [Solirubrobacteraceae bacterium]
MKRFRSLVLLVLAVSAATAVTAADSGASPGSGRAGTYGSAAANRARATAEAARLLALVALPPGAATSATEPAGDQGSLHAPTYDEATPNLVDAHAWWTTTAAPRAVLRYVAAHLPAGARLFESGSGSTGTPGQVGFVSETFALAPIRGVLSQRVLGVTAAALPHGVTGIRTDGEAIWLTPRPAWERIPGQVRRVVFTARGADASGRLGAVSRPHTLTGGRARRLVSFLNAAEVVQPGVVACPAGSDEWVALRFIGAGSHTLARAVENSSGCASVRLTIAGRTGPALNDYPSVTDKLISLGAVPVCAAGALAPSASPPGRDGPPNARQISFSFQNRSRVMCVVSGFPRVKALDAAGRPAPIHFTRIGAATARRLGLAADVVLDPGQLAQFGADYTTCRGAPIATLTDVSLPRVAGAFRIAVGTPREPFAPCHGAVSLGALWTL